MKKVYLIQALCPKRHCIIALAYELRTDLAPDCLNELRQALRQYCAEAVDLAIQGRLEGGHEIHPWCGICGAPRSEWTFEVGETRFQTMQEAQPELRALEAEQRLARVTIDAQKRKAGMN